MKKIIKGVVLIIAVVVLVSLVFYVRDKKERPVVSADELLQKVLVQIRDTKNYPEAIRLAREAYLISPDDNDIETALGHAFLLNGNIDSAKMHLANVIAKNDRYADPIQYMVNISLQEKDTAAAITYLNVYTNAFPEDRDGYLKKYNLLLKHRDYAKADSLQAFYIKTFSRDSIDAVSLDYWQSKAIAERKQNLFRESYASYQKAIRYNARDTAMLQQLVNLSAYVGDYPATLQYNHRLLQEDSLNGDYLVTASATYLKMGDKENAALYAGKAYALHPSDNGAKRNLAEMYLGSAKDAAPMEKIKYASLVLELFPSDKDALLYLVNGYLESDQSAPALKTADRALSMYPSSQVFIDKKIAILYDAGQYQACLDFIESIAQKNPTQKSIRAYDEVAVKFATELIREQRWEEARVLLEKGAGYNAYSKPLLEQLVNVYASQKNKIAAIETVNRLLIIAPANDNYLFKKSGLLESMGDYENAAAISLALHQKNPANEIYKKAVLDQLLGEERNAIQQQDWNSAITIYNKTKTVGTPGYDHLVYAIAAYNGLNDAAQVLTLTDEALRSYPGDSLLSVKRSLTLSAINRHPEALALTQQVRVRYPSDAALQLVYLDQLNIAGKYYTVNNRNDSAIGTFLTAHEFSPRDTFALMNLSAIYFLQRQYTTSIQYADLGLQLDSTNLFLLNKKVSAHEQLKQYRDAYTAALKVQRLNPSVRQKDYTDYLKNKTLSNQIGISRLQTFFDPSGNTASITGLQYTKRIERGTITGKVNYGERLSGKGLQLGLDVYYNHDSLYYSNIFLNGSTGNAFPFWHAGYSLFRNFKKGWEAELGTRYLGFDSINNYTITGAVGKYLNNTWVNAKAYYTYNTKDWFQSYQLTLRQYLNDKSDYISVIGGLGNIPDDQSLNYNLNKFSGLTSSSIGIGFQKQFRYRTILQAFINYSNLKVSPTAKLNQYDVYLTLLRNF